MRTDDRGHHYVDCMFCGQEWIVSRYAKEPYACPYCRAAYKKNQTYHKEEEAW